MSQTIKFNDSVVMKKLDEVKKKLEAVSLKGPSAHSLGQNQLDFTKKWLYREEQISDMVKQYKKTVHKNIDDTRSNVKKLKEQDEALAKK
ncbi:YwqI/YxiC family protein [Bacillus sp. CLL-7-23]|uniref:YwqI/YxiC family protein n=1 Tax=Bacillus changyiensis TaxID=3004103 RepID=A0ABT4WZ12_9BACI|nr:YwqI/YxiC family protein [Bacillus changyiensis]MDA7025286.1 YwqI/YxiC family protein [Bacillus changyiensis]